MPFILKIWASGIACVLWVSMAPSNLRPALGLQSHEFLNRVSSEFLNPLAHRVFASGRVLASSFIPLKIGPKESLNMADAFKKEERLCARRGGEVPRFHIDWVQHT